MLPGMGHPALLWAICSYLHLKSVWEYGNDLRERKKREVIWKSSFFCQVLEYRKAGSSKKNLCLQGSYSGKSRTDGPVECCRSLGCSVLHTEQKHNANIAQILGVKLVNSLACASLNRSTLAEPRYPLINMKQRAVYTSRNPYGMQA